MKCQQKEMGARDLDISMITFPSSAEIPVLFSTLLWERMG
jgi:hypothetical protein